MVKNVVFIPDTQVNGIQNDITAKTDLIWLHQTEIVRRLGVIKQKNVPHHGREAAKKSSVLSGLATKRGGEAKRVCH